jgi:3-oxoacyl-(acyl-carrier-protein) synthase
MTAVITGAGAVSAFGLGAEALWDGLAAGRCAVGPIRSFDASTFPTRVAGEVPLDPPAAAWLAQHRDRKSCFARLAAEEAWRSAGCGPSERAGAWLSLAVGLEQGFLEDFVPLLDQQGRVDWSAEERASLPPTRFRAPVDAAARAVAELLGLGGRIAVHVSACAAGAMAVAHAASLVERGAAPLVVCGGTDSLINPLAAGGMARIGAPSPRNASDACRPFDRRRDGLAIGEGAALFVVEDETRARARGARPLARIAGWGSSQDAYRATAPLPDGRAAARAMRRALERARLSPAAVGYINAHGTGTPLNDPAEARAIRAVFGAHADRLPVSSIKGAVGHLMVASGAIEIAACLMAFARDLLPGTANHRERDPECDIDVIGEAPRAARADVVLTNSFGFGGQNASVVLGRAA